MSPHILSFYMTLSPYLDQRRIQVSLELSGWIFTCLWTLGSTSSMMVGPVRLLIYLWWCFHVDSWHVMSWLAYILDLESWSAFVWFFVLVLFCQHSFNVALVLFKHLFIDVRLFHCIIVEHILECLVWWHSMSYVGYYLTLGHTPILEFIRSFADFLITWSISWSLWVVILGHTPFSALLLGHTPLFGFTTSHANFMVVRPICRSLQVIT